MTIKDYINVQRFTVLFILVLCFCTVGVKALNSDSIPKNVVANRQCLKCHGSKYYTYYNDWIERNVKERMNPFYVIDSAEYYQANHKNFTCIDCHSYEYEEFPHQGYLRMEPAYNCMDCHDSGDEWEKYNFNKIQSEYEKSIHSQKHNETFGCWMCHNPHEYKISARVEENIKDVIAYDNAICLNCHADIDEYMFIAKNGIPNILETHEWLPNQAKHFKSVRCIECHTQRNDTLLVAHHILPKEKAVKQCIECHSSNSLLMASLYRYEAKQKRSKAGFLNAALLGDYYVLGANRNYYLNLFSMIVFGLVLFGILVHIVLRIINK